MLHGEAIRRALLALSLGALSTTCYSFSPADVDLCAITCPDGVTCPDGLTCNPSTEVCETTVGECDGLVAGGTAIGAGFEHACAIDAEGALFCWGSNVHGQLFGGFGVDDQVAMLRPVAMRPGGVETGTWHGLAVGTYHACALRSIEGISDELWCWGNNGSGQVSPAADSRTAAIVATQDGRPWVEVVAGGDFTCARDEGGAVWCWGGNRFGQHGDGTFDEELRNPPSQVGGLVGTTQLVAGGQFACALDDVGEVWCWGDNRRQQAGSGDGDCLGQPCTVAPTAVATGFARLAAAEDTVCGARPDGGGIECWGSGERRIHAKSSDEPDTSTPVAVEGTRDADYVDLDLRSGRACAVHTDGTLMCWGGTDNAYGQRGLGDQYSEAALAPEPQQVPDMIATRVAVGTDFACAVGDALGEPRVLCWGRNYYGQVGDGSQSLIPVPTPVPTPAGREDVPNGSWLQVAAAGDTTCGVFGTPNVELTHQVHCWGRDSHGQASGATPLRDLSAPGPAVQFAGAPIYGVTSLAVGSRHSCVAGSEQGEVPHVYCWGDDSAEQLANGSGPAPARILGTATTSHVVIGDEQTCARGAAPPWACWGTGVFDGLPAEATRAMATAQSGLDRIEIAIGDGFQCKFDAVNDQLACRGNNDFGALGNGDEGGFFQLFAYTTDANDSLAPGRGTSSTMCWSSFFDMSGGTLCWGNNGWGQAGVPPGNQDPVVSAQYLPRRNPIPPDGEVDGPGEAVAVAVGRNHTCAVAEQDGNQPAMCWGLNTEGQLGVALDGRQSTHEPQIVPLAQDAVAIAAGVAHTCAIDALGDMYCWGSNEFGAVGSNRSSRLVPVPVAF